MLPFGIINDDIASDFCRSATAKIKSWTYRVRLTHIFEIKIGFSQGVMEQYGITAVG